MGSQREAVCAPKFCISVFYLQRSGQINTLFQISGSRSRFRNLLYNGLQCMLTTCNKHNKGFPRWFCRKLPKPHIKFLFYAWMDFEIDGVIIFNRVSSFSDQRVFDDFPSRSYEKIEKSILRHFSTLISHLLISGSLDQKSGSGPKCGSTSCIT